jgi:uncharacterized protein (TIGR00369 family)
VSELTERFDLDRLEQILLAPFRQWLGLKIKSCSQGQVEIEMPRRDESYDRFGSRCVLASLIDLTGLVVLLANGVNVKATSDLRADYLRLATEGPLIAAAAVVKIGRQVSVTDTRDTSLDAKLIARGQGAYSC